MQQLQSFHFTIMLVCAGLLVFAAVSDIRKFKIPNWVSLALIMVFPVYVYSAPKEIAWAMHIATCLMVLAIGFFLFAKNFAGAGDVKMLAAAALWSGPNYIGVLLVVTALAGGVLALIYSIKNWLQMNDATRSFSTFLQTLYKTPIPYGVAIASGGIMSLVFMAEPVLQ